MVGRKAEARRCGQCRNATISPLYSPWQSPCLHRRPRSRADKNEWTHSQSPGDIFTFVKYSIDCLRSPRYSAGMWYFKQILVRLLRKCTENQWDYLWFKPRHVCKCVFSTQQQQAGRYSCHHAHIVIYIHREIVSIDIYIHAVDLYSTTTLHTWYF